MASTQTSRDLGDENPHRCPGRARARRARPGNGAISFGSNRQELLDGCFGRQLALLEDLADVLADRRDRHLIQLGKLPLGQPDGVLVQP